MTIHPGRGCGPCHLCSKSAPYYSHLSAWDPGLSAKLRAIGESVTDDSCICRACEKDIKRKNNLENYVPRWAYTGSIENTPKCILPNCETTEFIVHSGLIKAKHMRDTSVNIEGKLVLLCQVHYKQVHRMINPQKYIGLTNIDTTSDDIIIQLSSIDTNLKLLHINKFIEALYKDPDLSSIPTSTRAKTLQIFLQDTTPDNNGFLDFIRSVGVAYFEKNRGAFDDDNPTGFSILTNVSLKNIKNGIMRSEPRCGQG